MHARLYKDVDKTLIRIAERIKYGERWERGVPFLRDPRIFVIIWNEKGEMIDPNPETTIFEQNEAAIRPKELNELHDIELEDL
jgi:hypothetical protein